MKKTFMVLLCLISGASYAGTQSGFVARLEVRAVDGLIFFSLSGAKTGSPACATRRYWMIKDENSNAGKQQYSMLLTAYTSGKPVMVAGMGTCTRWGDGEDVGSVVFGD